MQQIQKVPESADRPIRPSDFEQLRQLIQRNTLTPSELSVSNLYLFRNVHNYRLHLSEFPHIRGMTYDGQSHALPLCPLDATSANYFLSLVDCIYPLIEDDISPLLDSGVYGATDNSADADYIYSTVRLAALDGANHKRNEAERFNKLSPQIIPFQTNYAHLILDKWLIEAGKGEDHADIHECREAIQDRVLLDLTTFMVAIRDEPVGFLLASSGRATDTIVHFAKARRDLHGIYPWMFSHFAAQTSTPLINFEQDLGIDGLTRAKRALSPVQQLRKFRLRKNNAAID